MMYVAKVDYYWGTCPLRSPGKPCVILRRFVSTYEIHFFSSDYELQKKKKTSTIFCLDMRVKNKYNDKYNLDKIQFFSDVCKGSIANHCQASGEQLCQPKASPRYERRVSGPSSGTTTFLLLFSLQYPIVRVLRQRRIHFSQIVP